MTASVKALSSRMKTLLAQYAKTYTPGKPMHNVTLDATHGILTDAQDVIGQQSDLISHMSSCADCADDMGSCQVAQGFMTALYPEGLRDAGSSA